VGRKGGDTTVKKDLVISVLVTFCLTAILFTVIPVGSYGTYSPWIDYNSNGKIDVRDVSPPCAAYGSSGDPTRNVTVANWPSEINANVTNWPFGMNVTNWPEEISVSIADWPGYFETIDQDLGSSTIPENGQWWSNSIQVGGYKTYFLYMNASIDTGFAFDISVLFKTCGIEVVGMSDKYIVTSYPGTILGPYEIKGSELRVSFHNPSPYPVYVNVAIYVTR
jgi:hypothetical protein